MDIQEREMKFFDEEWKKVQFFEITGELKIPSVESFKTKRVLICSCGRGIEPVQAAKQGAETFAFDISETAVKNAREMAKYNNVKVKVDVMDFHSLSSGDNFFDIIYGSQILHHVDCSIVAKEIYRVLKPGGIAFFRENSDRNPMLRFFRRTLFGKPGEYQRQQFLFFKRTGTTDEYPLTEEEVETLSKIFKGNITVYNEQFHFFRLLNLMIFRNPLLDKLLRYLDSLIGDVFPFVKKYSFFQQILLKKIVYHS